MGLLSLIFTFLHIAAYLNWDEEDEDAIQKVVEFRNTIFFKAVSPGENTDIQSHLRQLKVDNDIDEYEYRAILKVYEGVKQRGL